MLGLRGIRSSHQLALSLEHARHFSFFVVDGVMQSWPVALLMRAKFPGLLPPKRTQRGSRQLTHTHTHYCTHIQLILTIVAFKLWFSQMRFLRVRSNHGEQCDWTVSVDHLTQSGTHLMNPDPESLSLNEWSTYKGFIKCNASCMIHCSLDVCPALPVLSASKSN